MFKKTITYTDYNGVERTEDFFFNLTKAELTQMEFSIKGGLTSLIQSIVAAQDTPTIMEIFKDVIHKSYGVKSIDGKRFQKSEELFKEFSETEAYSILFMELATDDKSAAEFINGIVPAEAAAELAKSGNNLTLASV